MTDVLTARIPEVQIPGKRLGRHVKHDPLSRGFAAERASQLQSVNHNAQGLPLDQGNLGSCTANALCGALDSLPNFLGGKPKDENNAVALYKLETKNEGQPYPPNDPGGSGLEVCKAAKQLGWISSYTHAFDVEHALLALVNRPVITGVSWYDSFDSPDKDGRVAIAKGAQVRGGHEIVADSIVVPPGATIGDLDQILVGLWNSWGHGYGVGGKFYWTAATWKRLLADQGDCTVPIV